MSNYLSEIENEYSRGRGKASLLTPLDWQLAQTWEDRGIPLRIVLAAMGDGFKKFHALQRDDTINSLRYFTQEVEKQFTDWQRSQVGKNTEKKSDMKDECFTAYASFDHTDVLEYLVERFTDRSNLPEPLASTVPAIRLELVNLIEDAKQKQLSTDDIETRLGELATKLALPAINSISESEREEMIAKINNDYGQRTLTDDSRAKILMRQLYDRFELPELTLFEI